MSVAKTSPGREQSRLNVRLAPEIKARVARAATIVGQDLTEFAVATLSQRANEVLARHDNILLDGADYRFFLDALSETETAAPSEKANAAAAKYRRGIRKGVRYHLAD